MMEMKCRKITKIRLASLFIVITITAGLFPAEFAFADGTVSISTVTDFKNFTEKCVYDEYSKNKVFVLQNDIDLADTEIKSAEVFCGTFDGGGHTIKNLKLSFEGSGKGLFNSVTSDAEIKNLNVEAEVKSKSDSSDTQSVIRQRAEAILSRVDIELDDFDSGSKAVGAIAGYNRGSIENCTFSGSVSGQNQVGAIAGYNGMTGIIDGCTNNGEISGDEEIGGIAGYNEGRVKSSKNNGSVCPEANENTISAGGICGNNEGAVVFSVNDGSVGGESFGDNIGGICGDQSGEIRECVNNGAVQGRRSVGGICGRFEPYTDIDLSYESAKASLRKQADIFKNDVSNAKSKLLDYGIDMLTGASDFSTIMSRMGLSDTVNSLKNLTDSATNMFDSISGAVNSANNNNISGSLRDTLNDVSSLSNETTKSLRETSDSINDSLTSLNDFLDEFDGKGQEITDLMDNLNDAIDKGEGDVDDIRNSLAERLDDLSEQTDDMFDKLSLTNTDLRNTLRQIKNMSGDVSDAVTAPLEAIDDAVTKLTTQFKEIKQSIEDLKSDIKGNITATPTPIPTKTTAPTVAQQSAKSGYKADPDGELDGSGYDVQSPVAAVMDFMFPTAHAADLDILSDDEKMAISDLKSTDISLPRLIGGEQADTALIKYCMNNGSVNGNELAGGVVGCTGFESVVRTGDSLKLPDGTQVSVDSVLKAVTDSCISVGAVTAKTDYAGGICGRSDIGNIKNSLSTGEITVTDGGYAGGVAGQSGGDIENCIAINDVYGDNHIGGIAGTGKDIKSSYALPRLYGANDKSGAIAGFITGDVENSYFIDEGLGGIDGANLAGKAEAVAPAAIAVSDGNIPEKMSGLSSDDFYMETGDLYMPQIKSLAENNAENIGALLQSKSSELARFRFDVVFKDKDKELKSMTVDYGTYLDENDIPKLAADGNEIPMWNHDTTEPIIRHTVFETVYNRATTTISTGETPAMLLVESVFDDNTTVSLKDETIDYKFSDYKMGNAYSFKLTRPAYSQIKVHIRDEEKKAAKIAVEVDGKWQITDCEMDGSYAVFTVNEPCKFVILYNKPSPIAGIFITIGILIAAVAAWIVYERFLKGARKNGGRSKTEEDV